MRISFEGNHGQCTEIRKDVRAAEKEAEKAVEEIKGYSEMTPSCIPRKSSPNAISSV